jgi:hypothetical protein
MNWQLTVSISTFYLSGLLKIIHGVVSPSPLLWYVVILDWNGDFVILSYIFITSSVTVEVYNMFQTLLLGLLLVIFIAIVI